MSNKRIYLCIRVYPNGEAKEAVRDTLGAFRWLVQNRRMRPGNALFINGRRPRPDDRGNVSEGACRSIEELLVAECAARRSSLIPEKPGVQFERIGGRLERYEGYPPEQPRKPIRFKCPA